MSRDRPQPTGDELFVVLLRVLGASPGALLAVCNDLEEERAGEETERRVIADAKRRVEVWG
jgi:hypothetical protein